ncbi:MAG: ATP-binding protein [Thermoanaerobaculales bacterium]|jgi:two-component system sensor histidine kinase CpxA|nr:ATP-binding protein [Thermoanaerobaculales bacterium]
MRSLFLRIFLLFWLAMAVIVAALVITSPFFTRSRPGVEEWRQSSEEWMRSAVDRIAFHFEDVDLDEIEQWRGYGRGRRDGREAGEGRHGGRRPPAPVRIFVFDESGRTLHGQDTPREAADLVARAFATGAETSEQAGSLHLLARPVTTSDGRRVVVVGVHESPPRLIHLLDPQALVWRLGLLFLVVGGLSFWLARYLTSPVAPLRRATRRLSSGDLSARVGGRVTRRRDEIGELARDFDAMAGRIEDLVASRERLLRDVSHELRSPLARLVVALELARTRAGEGAEGPLDRIEREAARLDELIGQLLLLERLEAGAVEPDVVDVDLPVLLDEIVADAGFEAAADGTDVELETVGDGRVSGRADLLRSAFDNIIRNAVHHADPGTAVEVRLADGGGGVTVTVRDRGSGVPEEDLAKLFEPFFRVGEARDRASGGAGLGLAIAARAVRAHGGEISAENHAEGGLVVTVRLPV